VVVTADVLPTHGTAPDRERRWKSLAATIGDPVVFLAMDLIGDLVHLVPRLLGPLLADPQVRYVKGCYTRPLGIDGRFDPQDCVYKVPRSIASPG
jgi:glucosyl-3-phosphoglycerate synthase